MARRPVAAFAPGEGVLLGLYERLLAQHGPQDWWPADSALEVMVGAVLTQNAAWTNVERAIAQLKAAEVLSLPALLQLPQAELAALIRPSGYYNIKAGRLRNLLNYLASAGGISALAERPTAALRAELLGVSGLGPETVDDILLYALDRPVFVIDAYTRRLLERHRLAHGSEPYEALRAGFEQALPADLGLYRQYHALVVAHAKDICRKRSPACSACLSQPHCAGPAA